MNSTTMNDWQQSMLKKYKLTANDINIIRVPFLKIADWQKSHNEFLEAKHYMCSCWQVTLLWYIDLLKWKCKDCSWYNK